MDEIKIVEEIQKNNLLLINIKANENWSFALYTNEEK